MSIDQLQQFVAEHTTTLDPEASTANGSVVDMCFFNVGASFEAAANPEVKARLIQLVAENEVGFQGTHMNPFDGNPHSYHDVGVWIGDQGLAMHFMALAQMVGIAKVVKPNDIFEQAKVPADVEKEAIQSGHMYIESLPA